MRRALGARCAVAQPYGRHRDWGPHPPTPVRAAWGHITPTGPTRHPPGALGQHRRSASHVDGRCFPYLNGFCGGWRPVSVFPIAW